MSRISIGKNSSAKHQFLGFLWFMANQGEIVEHQEDPSVTIDGVEVDRMRDIDWEPLKKVFPFSRYVDMTDRNLDLLVTPEDISPLVYQGMRSLDLFCFAGYLKIGLEWSDEYEMALAEAGQEYITERMRSFGDYIVKKRTVFLKAEEGPALRTQLVHVSLRPKAPVKPFLSGCGWTFSQKFFNVGIQAVVLKFNTIPNPHDCIVFTKATTTTLPLSTATTPNQIGTSANGERCMITRYDTLQEEVQEIDFSLLELE